MLNADQLGSAAQRWFDQRPTMSFYAPVAALRRETVGDGPYHVVVVIDAWLPTPQVRNILAAFPGVDVPRQTVDGTRVDEMSLHVLPENVYQAFAFHIGAPYRSLSLQPPPFEAPPTEEDLAAVFVAAMVDHSPAAAMLADAVSRATARVGWRTVASLINAMDTDIRLCPASVAAVLAALVCEPAVLAAPKGPASR